MINKIKESVALERVDSGWNYNCMCPNYAQYKKDNKQYQYDNICMVRIETADSAIAYIGQESYYEAMRDILNQVKIFLVQKQCVEEVEIYVFDYKTFIIAVKNMIAKEVFIQEMNTLHMNFQHATSTEVQITGSGSFVIISNQLNNVQTGINILFRNQNKKDSFIVCEKPNYLETFLHEESKAIELIEYALKNDKILPYYQGIRDNRTGKIVTYEALMRLIDKNDQVQTPNYFIAIAKKYNFLEKLTFSLINKVLADFKMRKENISINIAVSDLEKITFKKWFLEKIKSFPEPQRIIIEL